ncbi:transcriptional regulator [Frankia sp. CiP3]|uniref:transcriptional regulator n=1 Tax=Frankia sp. CiP3 TaxID=2880971 RepID=UPI001EF74570|nr:transcriptional regulator [Frankia sp. CiP3]
MESLSEYRAAPVFAHPLAYVRHARGWSLQRLVDEIAHHSRLLGTGNMANRREKAWRWEKWDVTPDRVTQLALARALDVPADHVDAQPWPRWLPTGDAVRVDFPWTPMGTVRALTDVVGDALMDRRGFLKLTGPALAALAGTWPTLLPRPVAEQVIGRRLSDETLTQIESRLPILRSMEDQLGGATVRRIIDAELGLATDLLDRATYTDIQGRRLSAAASELARLAGWASCDAGYHAAAQRYWVAALHAAHSAGIPALGANVLKNMTLQLLDFDQRTDALTVADAALSAGKGSTPRTRAMLAVRKARAHAALGDRRDCTRALSDAETHLGKGERDDDPAWVRYFDHAEYCAQVAMTFVELGTPVPADRYFAAALDPTSGISRVRDRATYLIRHAAVQVDLGDLDHAHALAHQALPHLEEAPSARNGYRIGELRSRLAPHRADPRIRILDTRLAAAA